MYFIILHEMVGLGRSKWKVSSFAQSEVKLPQAKHEHVTAENSCGCLKQEIQNVRYKKSGDKILNALLMLCIVVKKMVKEEKHSTHTRIYDKRSFIAIKFIFLSFAFSFE